MQENGAILLARNAGRNGANCEGTEYGKSYIHTDSGNVKRWINSDDMIIRRKMANYYSIENIKNMYLQIRNLMSQFKR